MNQAMIEWQMTVPPQPGWATDSLPPASPLRFTVVLGNKAIVSKKVKRFFSVTSALRSICVKTRPWPMPGGRGWYKTKIYAFFYEKKICFLHCPKLQPPVKLPQGSVLLSRAQVSDATSWLSHCTMHLINTLTQSRSTFPIALSDITKRC